MTTPLYTPASGIGNGVTKILPFGFRIFKSTDLKVITSSPDQSTVRTLALGVDYTVEGVNSANGGDVVLTTALEDGWSYEIRLNLPLVQGASFRNEGSFAPERHEDAFDYLMAVCQQQQETIESQDADLTEVKAIQQGDASLTAMLTGSIAGNVLTVTDIVGALAPGMGLAYSGSSTGLAVDALGTATGGKGTYILNQNVGTVTSRSMSANGAGILVLMGVLNALASTQSGFGDALVTSIQPYAGAVARTLRHRQLDKVNVHDFGAVGDGQSHPLSGVVQVGSQSTAGWTLAQWQALWPHVTALTNELDWAAFQAALNYAVSLGGYLTLEAGAGKTYRLSQTVAYNSITTSIDNLTLVGNGSTIVGGTAAILSLGTNTQTTVFNNRISIKGFNLTNGNAAGDGIVLLNGVMCDIDVTAHDLGGIAVKYGGWKDNGTGIGEWSHIKIRAFNVGWGFWGERLSTCTIDAVVRKGLNQGLHLRDAAQLLVNATVDEVTSLATPGTTDGVGIFAEDVDWSVINGSVGLCGKEALRLIGNSKWNKIHGAFYDSSVQTDGGFSNILVDTNGVNTPANNSFDVYAGWSGTGSANKPAYGLSQAAGANNHVTYIDATGCLNGTVGGAAPIHGSGAFKGAGIPKAGYNYTTGRFDNLGIASYKIDLDTDNTSGAATRDFIVSAFGGASNIFKVNEKGILIPKVDQGTTPPVPAAGQSEIWHDTAGSAYWLVFSPDGVAVKKVQLT